MPSGSEGRRQIVIKSDVALSGVDDGIFHLQEVVDASFPAIVFIVEVMTKGLCFSGTQDELGIFVRKKF